jgi:hypothetical protein
MNFQRFAIPNLDKIINISDVQLFKRHPENQLYLVHS